MSQSPLSQADTEAVLAALRAGHQITTPGSRCHSSFGWQDGGWYREDFDEGAVNVTTIDEAQVRLLLRHDPSLGRQLLAQLRWREVQAAVQAQDVPAALAALEIWQAYGQRDDTVPIATAWLVPTSNPDPTTAAAIRQRFEDGTLWHHYMNLVGWPQDQAKAARGCLAFVDTLTAGLAPPPVDRTRLRERLSSR